MLFIGTAIYTVILALLIFTKKFLFAFLVLIMGIVALFLFDFYKKQMKRKIKKLVAAKVQKHFINVNKEDWYILEEIPHLTKIEAKKAVFIRTKTGKYKSPEDFILKVGFREEDIEDVLNVITV